MLRSRLNSRSYHLLKTCQTCTTSCLPETLCRPALLIMSSQQHCKTGSCDQQIHISLAKRMPERREGEDSRIWSCSQGSCSHQEWPQAFLQSHSQRRAMGTSWSVQGLLGFISEAFGPELCQVIIYWSLMPSHLIGSPLQKVHFHLTLPPFSSTLWFAVLTVCSGWWAASPAQLGRAAGVKYPIPTAAQMQGRRWLYSVLSHPCDGPILTGLRPAKTSQRQSLLLLW